jgi:cytochrome b involved in lipid metabolism
VCAGTDTTKLFKDYGHSNDAKKIREKYLIGVLDAAPKK